MYAAFTMNTPDTHNRTQSLKKFLASHCRTFSICLGNISVFAHLLLAFQSVTLQSVAAARVLFTFSRGW